MSALSFQFDWEEPQGAKGPELRATWARLKILAEDTPVARLIDHGSRSVRESVFGPLYPIAEWIVMNWWALSNEVETPRSDRHQTFAKRHCLASAGEGFALPELSIIPAGMVTNVRWVAAAYPKARISFVETGTRWVKTESVARELTRFVTAVVARLESEDISSTPLQEEWAAIQAVDSEEAEFCAAAAALGQDPFAMDDSDRLKLVEISHQVREELLGEFLSATDFAHLEVALGSLNALLEDVRGSEASLPSLEPLRQRQWPVGPEAAPWERGYECARSLRNTLHLNGELLNTDERIAGAVGTDQKNWMNAVLVRPVSGSCFDGLVGPARDGHPAFVTSKPRGDSKRFAFCRGLYEYLTAADPQNSALVSQAHSDRQRANRAFAAEFLAPAALLRQRIGGDTVDDEQVDDLAAEFGVSNLVVRHQLVNHAIAAIIP